MRFLQKNITFFGHPEPGPELDSGSTISGSRNMLILLDALKILNQVQNDTFRVQHNIIVLIAIWATSFSDLSYCGLGDLNKNRSV
jgi:hypothetical protein